jgi:hypothetical protein
MCMDVKNLYFKSKNSNKQNMLLLMTNLIMNSHVLQNVF